MAFGQPVCCETRRPLRDGEGEISQLPEAHCFCQASPVLCNTSTTRCHQYLPTSVTCCLSGGHRCAVWWCSSNYSPAYLQHRVVSDIHRLLGAICCARKLAISSSNAPN